MDKCFECNEPAQANHHVVPKILGGTQTVPLCNDCHSKVHDKDLIKMKSLRAVQCEKLASLGRYVGGPAPFGYRWTAKKYDKELVINDEEKIIVQKFFSLVIESGKSLEKITKIIALEYNIEKMGRWRAHNLIKNKLYCGYIKYGGNIRNKIPTEKYVIVSEDDFDRAQYALLSRRRRTFNQNLLWKQ